MDTANFIATMLIDQEIPASTKLAIDMEVQQAMNTMVNGNDSPFDFPQSLKEAKELPEWPEWEKAIQSKLNMLCEKGTWKMAELPEGRKAIGNQWVFTKKFDNQGKLSRYKARLVAQGFSQIPGQDFEATFSPVMRMDSLQTLLAIAAVQDLEIGQMDIKGAYLNGDLKEEIYMRQPEGFNDQSGRACHLIHTLYGLKQSGREWNSRFDTFLTKNLKYRRLPVDHCIYIRNRNNGYDIIAIWVDDLLMVSTSPETMTKMKVEIEGEFEVTDQGEPKLLLGIEISRNRQTHTITISQGQYIHKCLQRFNMANSGVNSVPIQPGIKFNPTTEDNKFSDPSIYRAAIGSLLYAAIATRPDISYMVMQLAQFSANPSTIHWNAVKYLFKYLQGTKNLGITYDAVGGKAKIHATGFSDADWASNPFDRKSISGTTFLLAGGAIIWSSRKQSVVAQSSMEAEYIAANSATHDTVWLRELLTQLGFPQKNPADLFVDNQSAIRLANNPEFHQRSKHMDIKYHYICDIIMRGDLLVHWCHTTEQTANILTKGLDSIKFRLFCQD